MFPTLYKTTKNGKKSFWRIYVEGNAYHRESGLCPDGKVKKYPPVVATSKNIGKTNETTPEQQAVLEAESEFKHKKKQLYHEENEVMESKESNLRPMLAENFTKRKHHLKYPCGVSRKLDGVRVMVYYDSKKCVILSRQGTEYSFLDRIKNEITPLIKKYNVVFDGELYSHSIPFESITGGARRKNEKSEHDDLLEFHIFDFYDPMKPDMPYVLRAELLKNISKSPFSSLKFVLYDEIKDESQIVEYHNKYVAEGYEGAILRNLDGIYTLNRRVNDVQKYKDFEDTEFKIVDTLESESSTEKGAILFVCENKQGERFSVRPRGSIEERRKQTKNKKDFLGKFLTVRYQPMENNTVPRFPVGISVRDYD